MSQELKNSSKLFGFRFFPQNFTESTFYLSFSHICTKDIPYYKPWKEKALSTEHRLGINFLFPQQPDVNHLFVHLGVHLAVT